MFIVRGVVYDGNGLNVYHNTRQYSCVFLSPSMYKVLHDVMNLAIESAVISIN